MTHGPECSCQGCVNDRALVAIPDLPPIQPTLPLAAQQAAEALAAELASSTPQTTPALVPRPRAGLSLYEHEDWLLALADTAEGLTEEQTTERLAILDEIREATAAARIKRDSVARYLRELDALMERFKEEAAWISERRQLAAKHRERLRAHITHIVDQYAPQTRSGARKLEGEIFALSLRQGQDKVVVTDLSAVPSIYKWVTVRMTAYDYRRLTDAADRQGYRNDKPIKCEVEADTAAIKKALEAGEEVPGVDLEFGQPSLTVRTR